MYSYKVYSDGELVVDSKVYDDMINYFENNNYINIIDDSDDISDDYDGEYFEDYINDDGVVFFENEDIIIEGREFYDYNSEILFKVMIERVREK